MNSVSLVCTVHENAGLANASVLLSILERIQPEVVFVELPPEAFEDFYGSCSQYNLESMAVRQYREGRRVKPVAVDLPRPSGNFASNIEPLTHPSLSAAHSRRRSNRRYSSSFAVSWVATPQRRSRRL
jgi:hypothetical protein